MQGRGRGERWRQPSGASRIQALDLRAAVHVPGLSAGSNVVIGTLLPEADSPLLHRQEGVHRIYCCSQEAKNLGETGLVSLHSGFRLNPQQDLYVHPRGFWQPGRSLAKAAVNHPCNVLHCLNYHWSSLQNFLSIRATDTAQQKGV